MAKLPAFSGYCPPGQLRSMSQRLGRQAILAAHARRAWAQPDTWSWPPAPTPYARLSWVAAAACAWLLLGTLGAKYHWLPAARPAIAATAFQAPAHAALPH